RFGARSSFLRSLPQRLQESSHRRDDERRHEDRRQEVSDFYVPDSKKFETHAHEEQAADRAHLPKLKIAEYPGEQRCSDGEATLIDKDERDRQKDAPPQG